MICTIPVGATVPVARNAAWHIMRAIGTPRTVSPTWIINTSTAPFEAGLKSKRNILYYFDSKLQYLVRDRRRRGNTAAPIFDHHHERQRMPLVRNIPGKP